VDLTLLLHIRIDDLVVCNNDQVVRSVWVDFDLAELASADVILEQNVEISISETLEDIRTEFNHNFRL
jgi:hypothetical protein